MFLDNLEKMIYFLDEPIADPAALNTLMICQEAKKKNIKVLLSGTGGMIFSQVTGGIFRKIFRFNRLHSKIIWTRNEISSK